MNDNQFDKLFTYITDMDKRIEGEFAKIKDEIRELRNIPDDVASRFSYITDEQAARDAQFERLLAWARKVSEKTGIPLEGF